jgi:hypothetical protein
MIHIVKNILIMSKKNKLLFHLEFVTDKDERKRYEEIIQNLTEEQKSDWVYKDEPFYYLGRGHAFLFGFFSEFITKSGIKAWRYDSGKWLIDGHDFTYNEDADEFELIPQPEISNKPINWDEIQFPKVKKLSGPIGLKLPTVYPQTKPNESE